MSFAATSLKISSGVIVWALHFAAIYGFTALACAREWESLVRPAVLLATAVAAAASIAIIVWGLKRRGEFEAWLAAMLAGFGLIGIVYEAIPVFLVPICA